LYSEGRLQAESNKNTLVAMDRPLLSRDQCRELDRRAIEEYGFSGVVLMENAGRGCVDVLEQLGIDGPLLILCGKGNNAGDGFVIARHLKIRGHAAQVFVFSPREELRGDAATNFAILQNSGMLITEFAVPSMGPFSTPPFFHAQLDQHAGKPAWLIDAMLGTGAVGEPRPPFDAVIDWMNAQPAKKLAVDVPSGLDCNTGEPAAHTVRADHTCTFAAMKIGFTQSAAKSFIGTVHVCDIGVPPQLIHDVIKNSSERRGLSPPG
jgi:NAD(P)H-hydrate epimerase